MATTRHAPGRRLGAAVALALACVGAGCADHDAPGLRARLRALAPLDVVWVVVDTLRADWTTPYGDREDATPELARWARRGVVFENTLAQSSWTKVSMASMMTSRWPRHLGVEATRDALAPAALTLAEVFSEAGYQTFAVQSNGWLEQTFGFHQGFDRYMFPRGGGSLGARPMVWPHADNVYLEADRLLDHADPDRPLLLYLHFMDVHEYAAPPDVAAPGAGAEGAYRASIRWVDEVVGRLRERLADAGRLDRTLMVLTSDHGESFGENGVHGHARDVRPQGLWVPFVIRLPFAIEPVRVARRVRNLDVAPTLLDLAGVPVPATFDGDSLVGVIERPDQAADRPSFASLPALLYRDARQQDGVVDGTWSYRRDVADGVEYLYERSIDPAEHVNLAEIERVEADRMRARLDAHLAAPPDARAVESNVRIQPALAEKLRALGYLPGS